MGLTALCRGGSRATLIELDLEQHILSRIKSSCSKAETSAAQVKQALEQTLANQQLVL